MGIARKRGWGLSPGQYILEHFFKGTQYLGNIPKAQVVRGGQGHAKRVGAFLKDFVLLDFFKGFFLFGQNVQGGFGECGFWEC